MEPSSRARPAYRGVVILLGAVLLVGNGCSWAFVRRPTIEELESLRAPQCTRSAVAPVIDTFFGAGFLTLGAVALSLYPQCVSAHEGFCGLDVEAAIVAALIATPFIISSIHGYTATAECRELERGYAACFTGVERSCSSPPPVGDPARLALSADPGR